MQVQVDVTISCIVEEKETGATMDDIRALVEEGIRFILDDAYENGDCWGCFGPVSSGEIDLPAYTLSSTAQEIVLNDND